MRDKRPDFGAIRKDSSLRPKGPRTGSFKPSRYSIGSEPTAFVGQIISVRRICLAGPKWSEAESTKILGGQLWKHKCVLKFCSGNESVTSTLLPVRWTLNIVKDACVLCGIRWGFCCSAAYVKNCAHELLCNWQCILF